MDRLGTHQPEHCLWEGKEVNGLYKDLKYNIITVIYKS